MTTPPASSGADWSEDGASGADRSGDRASGADPSGADRSEDDASGADAPSRRRPLLALGRRPLLALVGAALLAAGAGAQVVARVIQVATFDWAGYAAEAEAGGAPLDAGPATAISAGTFALTILASGALAVAAVAVLVAALRPTGRGPRAARVVATVIVALDVLGVYWTAQFPGTALVVLEAGGVLLLWLPTSRVWFGDRAPERRDLGSP